MKVGYRKNEVLLVYYDEHGDMQILPFDTYEEAVEYTERVKEYTRIVGIMTTRFYNCYIEQIIEEDTINEDLEKLYKNL